MFFSIKVIWILVAIAFGIIEAMTLSLTMIWFTIGALVSLGVSYATDNIFVQIIVFAVTSFLLLFIATKKLINMDRKNDRRWVSIDTNLDVVIGQKGFVISEITPQNVGIVKVKGEDWTAISHDFEVSIPVGKEIVVEAIDGVKLVVKESIN